MVSSDRVQRRRVTVRDDCAASSRPTRRRRRTGRSSKSWNASSDVPNVFTDALQPVCSSNGVTQSTSFEVEPFSAYPGHARMLTVPSPLPIDVGGPVVLLDCCRRRSRSRTPASRPRGERAAHEPPSWLPLRSCRSLRPGHCDVSESRNVWPAAKGDASTLRRGRRPRRRSSRGSAMSTTSSRPASSTTR